MINPFRQMNSRWEVPVAVMSLLLGAMLYMAWITNPKAAQGRALPAGVSNRLAASSLDLEEVNRISEELQKVTQEVQKLRAENTKLQNAVANNSKQSKVLNDSLQDVKLFAGLTEVEGPGLTVTLMDSRKQDIPEMERIVHDRDVLMVVNELWAAGAEAIEVNGNRLVGSSSIRCAGPVIHIDNKAIASPIKIRAIGDPDTLEGAMNLPGGVLEELRNMDSESVRIDRVKKHRLSSFSRSTEAKFAKLPKDSK